MNLGMEKDHLLSKVDLKKDEISFNVHIECRGDSRMQTLNFIQGVVDYFNKNGLKKMKIIAINGDYMTLLDGVDVKEILINTDLRCVAPFIDVEIKSEVLNYWNSTSIGYKDKSSFRGLKYQSMTDKEYIDVVCKGLKSSFVGK